MKGVIHTMLGRGPTQDLDSAPPWEKRGQRAGDSNSAKIGNKDSRLPATRRKRADVAGKKK